MDPQTLSISRRVFWPVTGADKRLTFPGLKRLRLSRMENLGVVCPDNNYMQ